MMYSNRNLVFLAIVLGCLPACSAGTVGQELAGTEANSQALTAAEVVSGFESIGAWSVATGSATLTLTTDHFEGTKALEVKNLTGYTTLVSDFTGGPATVGDTITLRVKPPAAHAQAWWKGQVQLSVHSQSRQLYSRYIDDADLSGLVADSFGTLSFSLPADVRTALSTGSVSDVRYTLALNLPLSGPYLLDALQLGAAVSDPTPTPTPKAYTGGRDVAILWKPIQWSRQTVQYDVYRNGQLIGSAAPSLYQSGNSAATYIDRGVTDGQSYTYEVQAVAGDGARAARSAAVSIRHSTLGTPVPTILTDTNGFPHTLRYLERGKAFLETWYPKIANIIADPEDPPPGTITLRAIGYSDENPCPGAGWTDGTPDVVHLCAYENLSDSDDVGLVVHEATHLIQAYGGPQLAAAGESIASWAGNLAIGRANKKSGAHDSYFDDYEYGAYFFDWIAETYGKPNFIRDLNLVCHRGTYTDAWPKQYTGYTLGQMFGAMVGAKFSSPGVLKNAAGGYAYPIDSNPKDWGLTPGSPIHLLEDPPSNRADFFQGPISEASATRGTAPLRWNKEFCLAEDAQHFVVAQKCKEESPAPSSWLYVSLTGAYYNLKTGRCLQAQGAVSEGRPLVTAQCNNTDAQRWEALPL